MCGVRTELASTVHGQGQVEVHMRCACKRLAWRAAVRGLIFYDFNNAPNIPCDM